MTDDDSEERDGPPTCRRDGCNETVPEESRKRLNLGQGSGYCDLACMLEDEDDQDDRGDGVETDGGPPSDRVPERVRLARRERKREGDRRAEERRLGR